MKNPFIPNPKANWCYKCKSHIHIKGLCSAYMFCPSDVKPWMYGLSAFTLMMIGLGCCFWHYPPYGLRDYGFSDPAGLKWFCFSLAAFFGLIGGMMIFYMGKWFAWASAQKRKTAGELESELRSHPFLSKNEESEN